MCWRSAGGLVNVNGSVFREVGLMAVIGCEDHSLRLRLALAE